MSRVTDSQDESDTASQKLVEKWSPNARTIHHQNSKYDNGKYDNGKWSPNARTIHHQNSKYDNGKLAISELHLYLVNLMILYYIITITTNYYTISIILYYYCD